MGRYLYVTPLPLSRLVTEAGGDPDVAWQILSLDEWTNLPAAREVWDRHPELLDDLRRQFRQAFEPKGTVDLGTLLYFYHIPYSVLDVRGPRLFPTTWLEAKACVLAYDVWFERQLARPLYRLVDGYPVNEPLSLGGIEVRPGLMEGASVILAQTLRETDLEDFRARMPNSDPILAGRWTDYAFAADMILDVFRKAKVNGLDVLCTRG